MSLAVVVIISLGAVVGLLVQLLRHYVAVNRILHRRWQESDTEFAALEVEHEKVTGYVVTLDMLVEALRDLLPGEKKPVVLHEILEAFGQKAVADIGTLLEACIDYRNLLIRAVVADQVSIRHEGVEAIAKRYGVKLERRGTMWTWTGAQD